MSILSASERDVRLCHRVYLLTAWLQLGLGLLLTIRCLIPAAYGVLAVYLPLVLLLVGFGFKKRVFRVVTRVLTAAVWVLAGLFLLMLILNMFTGWSMSAIAIGYDMSGLCLPVLPVIMPGLAVVALRGGRYDKVVACFAQTWLFGIGVVALFTEIRGSFPWVWNNSGLLYLWLGLMVLTTVMGYVCAVIKARPTEELPYGIL